MSHYKQLVAYQKAYDLAIKIYQISKKIPRKKNFH
jgi:hypothetical protein